ncbi:hypothetical protein [Novipirellula rosea]|uniref:Uncharacterized protein n=1 Tax=Novipirellula rosea TaxID=1031540 RepID=A0ABP8MYF3_9BACT|tara:strand:+ start:1694 stop:2143 length:450 start_codon:yes stop_codon:yes gene_type:complete
MKSIVVAAVLALAAIVATSESASAQYPDAGGVFPFGGYGFYSPYGSYYGTSLRTPPYFATNPPVYYGARYARPYGMSPFAAPPMVNAPTSYRGRLESEFMTPPGASHGPIGNPCISYSASVKPKAKKMGPVRENPYVSENADADKLAQN